MKLLTSQKNQLFDIIENTEFFSPSQFELQEVKTQHSANTKLSFKNSDYYVAFLSDEKYYHAFYLNLCPGDDAYVDVTDHTTWDNILGYFRLWLYNLKREVSAPNKWQRLLDEVNQPKLLISDLDNDQFSYEEYKEIESKLKILSQSISTIPLLENQQAAIISKLDQLSTLAQKANKFDWKSQFVGTIISIIIQLNVTPDNAAALWALIRQVFHNFFLPK